ncbi:MAG: UDP-N-acetylmuramate dehydrogenase [Saprospiraceae bacterium]
MISLQKYNTFSLKHYCEELHIIHNERNLLELLPFISPPLIIGGGSNILLTQDHIAPVLINEIKGKKIVKADSDSLVVKLGSGENWHEVVLWAIENDLGGIENLSLIPGKCGAAPIQNIGAYGVEIKDVFVRLDAIDLQSGKKCYFDKIECNFGYRDSIFKSVEKGRYFILHVYLRLNLPPYHKYMVNYGKVLEILEENNIINPSIRDISNTIISIRKSKLPDPKLLPNCGSFFKNPIIPLKKFEELKLKHPDMPWYSHDEGWIKVPAGWLIEQCGWKGKIKNGVGCHKDHALVICNYSAEYGRQIERYYLELIDSVSMKYEIELTPEVNIW